MNWPKPSHSIWLTKVVFFPNYFIHFKVKDVYVLEPYMIRNVALEVARYYFHVKIRSKLVKKQKKKSSCQKIVGKSRLMLINNSKQVSIEK